MRSLISIIALVACTSCKHEPAAPPPGVTAAPLSTPPPSTQPAAQPAAPVTSGTRTGEAATGDWTSDAPGVRRKLTVADLPAPHATESVDNGPTMVERPAGALPRVPAGFV
ncbi:MAG TPA: hypothetical protein VGC42_09870, partial [Kofleriaceae bacterium]